MKQEDLKKGTVYLYYGSGGADGANILFSPAEDGSFDYQGSIVLHWTENRVNISKDKPTGYAINKAHLPNVIIASEEAAKYYDECAKNNEDTGEFDWHDSNDIWHNRK